jgi:DNA-directed RNA polymerase specialized sigma24 family protein
VGKRKTAKKSKDHYVDKDELRKEVKISQDQGFVSDNLAEMFVKIVNGLSHRFQNLAYYGISEDVKQDCLLLLCQKYVNFDPDRKTKSGAKSSPFAYFTTVVYNQMRYQATKEKRRKERHDDLCHKMKLILEDLERYF